MKEHREYFPCNPEIPCRYREEDECFEDIHHEAYPKSEYRTALEKRFRNHVMNKVLTCRALHDDEHAQNLPPRKATPKEMQSLMDEYDKETKKDPTA
jgi:hypothetical protein